MKKVLKIVVNVLAWILLILAFLVTLMIFSSGKNNGQANLFGFMPMSVQTGSMSPTFNQGDMILVKELDDVYSLKKGDVITFWTIIDGTRQRNTHRIVEVIENDNSRSFKTKGDNNAIEDTYDVPSAEVIGKWTGTRFPGVGKALDFLKTKKGFFICIVIPMALFFLFELYKFIVVLIELKKPDTPEIDEEEIKKKAIEEYLAKKAAEEAASSTGANVETAVNAAETVSADASEAVTEAASAAEAAVTETVSETTDEEK